VLSDREREVLTLVALGYTNKEIAQQIHVSVKSVESYRARVADKLGLHSRAELVRYALETGLIG
jgi:two-component system response regulator NreC